MRQTAAVRGPVRSVALALARVRGLSDHDREFVLDVLRRWRHSGGRASVAASAMLPSLASRGFAWPEFDRWQAFFTAANVFPARWDGLRAVPSPGTPAAGAYHRRKLDLLFDWLDALARRSTVLAHYARQGLVARIERQDTRAPCAACAPFVGRQVESGIEPMPPFHPGCRCLLLAVRPPGARQRRRPSSRGYREES